jgi:hypothetical protein
VTAAGSVSGASGPDRASRGARVTAVLSLLLAASLSAVLPTLLDAADHLAVLAVAVAGVALAGSVMLWWRPTLLSWTATTLAATVVVLAAVLEVGVGLPGAAGLPEVGPVETATPALVAVAVLLTAVARGVRQEPLGGPDHPYALAHAEHGAGRRGRRRDRHASDAHPGT